MDSREKQNLMDEFGAAGEPGTDSATAKSGNDGDGAADVSSQDAVLPDNDGIVHEFDPMPVDEADETTLTDGLVFDVIHDIDTKEDGGAPAKIGEDPLASELNETRERMLRLAAEFENFKKRRIREREEHLKYANERLLKDFLPVLDNLDRALESARQNAQNDAIVSGLELVVHEFLSVLAREGVTPVESVGKPFDPALQDALQQIETTEVEPGCVAAEVLKGYLLNGRVLRAALVVVAREP